MLFSRVAYGLAVAGTKVHPRLPLSSAPRTIMRRTSLNRNAAISARRYAHTDLKTPSLFQVPRLWNFAKNKFSFMYIRHRWDPEFTEGAFIYGTMNAICRICSIIHGNKTEDLKGLLTDKAHRQLISTVLPKLTNQQRKVLALSTDDIKILAPTNVKIDRAAKTCDVALRCIALKWIEHLGKQLLVLIALESDFVRDFSMAEESEWTINKFSILEFAVVGRMVK